MIKDLEAKLDTLGKGKEPLQLTKGIGEDEEQDSDDEEEEEEQDDKGKSLVFVMPPSKKAQGTKNKLIVKPISPPSPNKPRTRETTSIEQSAKKKVVEAIEPSAPKTKIRDWSEDHLKLYLNQLKRYVQIYKNL